MQKLICTGSAMDGKRGRVSFQEYIREKGKLLDCLS